MRQDRPARTSEANRGALQRCFMGIGEAADLRSARLAAEWGLMQGKNDIIRVECACWAGSFGECDGRNRAWRFISPRRQDQADDRRIVRDYPNSSISNARTTYGPDSAA